MQAWYTSEIKACHSQQPGAVREARFCQMAEGAEIGKRNQDEEVCLTPKLWFVIGAQAAALHESLGTRVNGRVRAYCALLDRKGCQQVKCLHKFMSRSTRFQFLGRVSTVVAAYQQQAEPKVKHNTHSPGRWTVHAAMHDAASKALETCGGASEVVATMLICCGEKALGA